MKLKPLKVPSRPKPNGLGNDGGGGSPRHARGCFGKPRGRTRGLAMQMALLLVVGMMVFRRVDDFRGSDDLDSSPARKRQLIADSADSSADFWIGQTVESTSNQIESIAQRIIGGGGETAGISMFPKESSVSQVFAHPTAGPSGNDRIRYFYRFTNVRIGNGGDTIEFFGGPGYEAPEQKLWYDVVIGNSSTPEPPTVLVFSGAEEKKRTIQIKYLASNRPDSSCTKWMDSPSLLLHVSNADSMWQSWTKGLIPTFQTFRELGYLPLMQIGADGKVQELTTGITPGKCPNVVNPETGVTQAAVDCLQTKSIPRGAAPEYCGSEDTWCRLGVWPHAAHMRTPHPAVFYTSDSVVAENPWGALYSAVAGGGVRSWSAGKGTCVRNLVVGFSQTLSVGEALASGGESGAPLEQQVRISQGLETFSRYIRSAMDRLEINNAIEFLRYSLSAAERLRRGITLGHGRYIDLRFKTYKELELAEGDSRELIEEFNYLEGRFPWVFEGRSEWLTPREKWDDIARQAAHAAQPSPLGPPRNFALQQPLPVVTYISTWGNLTGSVLNDRHVLRFIYWRYNVTIKVTTLSEHEATAAKLLAATDVLIGPAGPHWAHAVFLKPGAVSLQLLPYGSRSPDDGTLLQGGEVAPLIHFRHGSHLNWVNPHAEFSFFRKVDFVDHPEEFQDHPSRANHGGKWSTPFSSSSSPDDDYDDDDDDNNADGASQPHPAWVNANTFADMNHLGPYIEEVMLLAGVAKMDPTAVAAIRVLEEEAEREIEEAREKLMAQQEAAYEEEEAAEEESDYNDSSGGGGDYSETGEVADYGEKEDAEEEGEEVLETQAARESSRSRPAQKDYVEDYEVEEMEEEDDYSVDVVVQRKSDQSKRTIRPVKDYVDDDDEEDVNEYAEVAAAVAEKKSQRRARPFVKKDYDDEEDEDYDVVVASKSKLQQQESRARPISDDYTEEDEEDNDDYVLPIVTKAKQQRRQTRPSTDYA